MLWIKDYERMCDRFLLVMWRGHLDSDSKAQRLPQIIRPVDGKPVGGHGSSLHHRPHETNNSLRNRSMTQCRAY